MRHLILALALASTAHAGSIWPQFRGPSGASTATNEIPPTEIDTAKNLLWQRGVPAGSASPVIVGGRAFFTGFADGKIYIRTKATLFAFGAK